MKKSKVACCLYKTFNPNFCYRIFQVGALLMMGQVAQAQVTNEADLMNAVNNGSAGDTVVVATGTFALTGPLRPKINMTIRGAGVGQTVLTSAASWQPGTAMLPDSATTFSSVDPNGYLFDLGSNTTGVTISDMTLTGPNLHGALRGNNCDNLHLYNLFLNDFLWCGIRTFSMDGGNIHDCEFADAGGRWNAGAPASTGGTTGGGIYVTWMKTSQIWNCLFYRTLTSAQRNFYGIKGRQGRNSRIHHNTIETNFSIEFPHENDEYFEIDHNMCTGAISIPKNGGGSVPTGGYTFHIHHNWFKKGYSLEWTRNGAEVDHNLFDIDLADDDGNLMSGFATEAAPGPTDFHNNLVRNFGRGIAWFKGPFAGFRCYNNHFKTDNVTRTEGIFGFHTSSTFSTIQIKDNIIECSSARPRPLMRNAQSYAALIQNNTLTNVSDTGSYANTDTGAIRGPTAPVQFFCGANDEFHVDGWNAGPAAVTVVLAPAADAHVYSSSASTNYGGNTFLSVRQASKSYVSYVKVDLNAVTGPVESAKLRLNVKALIGSQTLTAFEVTDDSWTETGIVWNNRPAQGTALGSATASVAGEWIEFDVTGFVQAQLAGDRIATIAIGGSSSNTVDLWSRESATNPVELVINP
jgi:nitrous oxidase accessory protein